MSSNRSVSSWCDLSTSVDNNEFDSWSVVSNELINLNTDVLKQKQQILNQDHESHESEVFVEITATDDDDTNDDFEHLSQQMGQRTASVTSSFHEILNTDFDVRSIPTTIRSVDTVNDNFIFADYQFKKRKKKKSQWMRLTQPRKKYKRRFGRKHKNYTQKLGDIDENIEYNDGVISKNRKTKKVVDIGDLGQLINGHIGVNRDIGELIRLCNVVAKQGTIVIGGTVVELHEMPLIGLKLRDIFFRKLVLLKQVELMNGTTLTDTPQQASVVEEQYLCLLRREVWLKLNMNARLFLLPFGSLYEFNELYYVHYSVQSAEILSVLDEECFAILMKPAWVKCVLYQDYLSKIQSKKWDLRVEELEMLNEIQTVCSFGVFDLNDHCEKWRNKQMSLYSYGDDCSIMSDDFQSEFSSLEKRIEKEMKECSYSNWNQSDSNYDSEYLNN